MLKAWITVQGSSEQLKACYINVPTPTKKKIRYIVFKIIFVLLFFFTQSEQFLFNHTKLIFSCIYRRAGAAWILP